jgi:cell division ATPase FtsA
MGRKSVAVLDVRSSEVAVIIGERGVNNTFVLKGSKTEEYDGYDEEKFYDANGLADAVIRAVSAVEQMCGERIKELYVGVPGAFTVVEPKEQSIAFPKKRKIGQKEIDALFASGNNQKAGYHFIRATSMIFVTADNRRVVDPSGLSSAMLSGVLSYFYCSEYFVEVMEEIFSEMKINLHYLPSQFAMATYLIPSETRDEYAIFFDAGNQSSTMSVLLGNGVLAQETFPVGRANVVARLMQEFSLPYEAAVSVLSKANLYAKNGGSTEYLFQGVPYEIDSDKLIETVKEGLDGICEAMGAFLEDCSGKELDYKPVFVTGEGLFEIRGALEHISKRVNRVCEQLAPDLPYYNKPSMSSRIALIDLAYEDHRKNGLLQRILNGFGG